jgi:hypothetical protein
VRAGMGAGARLEVGAQAVREGVGFFPAKVGFFIECAIEGRGVLVDGKSGKMLFRTSGNRILALS